MQIESFRVKSHMDNLSIGGIVVRPDGEPKAVLQILHGMCEHKERYLPFMEYLAEHGFASIIHDHRGHGESVKHKDDLGFMYKNGANAIVEDTNQINRIAREQFPNIPLYMLGHSMGSLVARTYIKRYDRALDGLIVCGSPSNNPLSGLGILLSKAGGLLLGQKKRAIMISDLMFKHNNDEIENPKSVNSWICATESVVEEYDRDDLCGFIFTYNGMENLCKLVKSVYEKRNWSMNKPELPIFFISGQDDPCRTSDKKFMEAVEHLKNVGYKNVSHKTYKGMRHEILNEADHMKVYKDVLAQLEFWLNRHKK
ncbi:MAG: alpha/beta fold hydrolase [bacterium]|nr:alpha/beta fold hydrolase [bacterium]